MEGLMSRFSMVIKPTVGARKCRLSSTRVKLATGMQGLFQVEGENVHRIRQHEGRETRTLGFMYYLSRWKKTQNWRKHLHREMGRD